MSGRARRRGRDYHTEPGDGIDELRIRAAGTEDVVALANLMTELGYATSVEDMKRRFEEISADLSYDTLVAERENLMHARGMTQDVNYQELVMRLSTALAMTEAALMWRLRGGATSSCSKFGR